MAPFHYQLMQLLLFKGFLLFSKLRPRQLRETYYLEKELWFQGRHACKYAL